MELTSVDARWHVARGRRHDLSDRRPADDHLAEGDLRANSRGQSDRELATEAERGGRTSIWMLMSTSSLSCSPLLKTFEPSIGLTESG